MTTKIYKIYSAWILPEHINWARKQAKKSGISLSHLERIIKDMAMEMDIEEMIEKYNTKKSR